LATVDLAGGGDGSIVGAHDGLDLWAGIEMHDGQRPRPGSTRLTGSTS
jgi:hypothetical protein